MCSRKSLKLHDNEEVFSQILRNNIQREESILNLYACKSANGSRKNPALEKIPDEHNIRPIFWHDADKIMHSRAYTRYIDKTQAFCLFENDHITHRVLHVQLVSKIGRVIGRCLNLNEDLIEAIALGHDLGHAPYGHDGEKVLDKLCKEAGIGSFCHNAQSVRLVNLIERKGKGLNLSLQVLDGMLCHNGELPTENYVPAYGKTWETFESEYLKCMQEREYSKKISPMTLEGCVVRVSDIIAYIGRDVEDAMTLGVIGKKAVPLAITKALGGSNDKIIDTLVRDLLINSYGKDHLAFSGDIFKALDDLLDFNNREIYLNPAINTESDKIANMFKQLFTIFLEDLKNHNDNSAIHDSTYDMDDRYVKDTPYERMVVDYLAGMTDDFLNNQFQERLVPQSYGYSLK